jgi:hypothetical protein
MDAPVTYQWHRDGVAIAGATGPSYLLGGAQVSDDGAQFNVVARGANGTAVGSAQLHVSSTPPVVFQDTEFQVANWSVATIASSGNPSFTALRSETGGNPDAYRLIVHRTLAGTSDLQLVHSNQLSVYDPRQSGAVYVIEFAVDCEVVSRSPGVSPNIPQYAVTLEQAGRVYQIGSTLTFCDTVWKTLADASVTAGASKQLTGPPCSATEMCPDLSADGAPLRFGLFTEARTASGSVEGTMQLGFDNWKVSVWRR